MALKYRDVEGVNASLDQLSNTLLRNRALDAEQGRFNTERSDQKQRFDAQQGMEQKRLDLATQGQQNEQDFRTQELALRQQFAGSKAHPVIKWTGEDGVSYTANSMQDFASLVQEHPAAKKDGKSSVAMTGTDEHGNVVTKKWDMTNTNPESKQSVAQEMGEFSQSFNGKPAKPSGPFQAAIMDAQAAQQKADAATDPTEKSHWGQIAAQHKAYADKLSTVKAPAGTVRETVKRNTAFNPQAPEGPGNFQYETNRVTTTPLNLGGSPAAPAAKPKTVMGFTRDADGNLIPTP